MKLFKIVTGQALVLFFCITALADVPRIINFQGRLSDANGNPVANAVYPIKFEIYDAVGPGGGCLWLEIQNVSVQGGLFSVVLGSVGQGIPDSAFNASTRWLAITVGNDPEMSPRLRLGSEAYSYRVNSVEGAAGGNIYGDLTLHSTFTTGDLIVTNKARIGISSINTGADAFVAGKENTASGNQSTISGGRSDTASGELSTVGGGGYNAASADRATVGGGFQNKAREANATVSGGIFGRALGTNSTVGGGDLNTASGFGATVSGGESNVASNGGAFVGGGYSDTASGDFTTVSGGLGNTASDTGATVGGGGYNKARGKYSVIGGGGGTDPADSNSAQGDWSVIGGGTGNRGDSPYATIGGGAANVASGNSATVAGGFEDTASGYFSTVPGGKENTAAGDYSFAAGRYAKANHNGSFVWADVSGGNFASTGTNQFLIRATGGVGINTAPDVLLNVKNLSDAGALVRIGDNTTDLAAKRLFFGDGDFVSIGEGSTQDDRMEIKAGNSIYINTPKIGINVLPSNPLELVSGAYCSSLGVWTNASSRKYKTEIEPLNTDEYTNILKKLEGMDVVHFRYKADPTRKHIGMIAEDVPEEISSEKRDGIPTADAIAFLMAAVKAQQCQIEQLKATVKDLKENQRTK